METPLIPLLLFLLAILSAKPLEAQELIYLSPLNKGAATKVVADIQDGLFHGNYQSYYENGQLCAKGQFEYNFRMGEWSVWDEEGQLKVKRLYTAPLVYTTLYPNPPSSPLIELLNVPQYYPQRNEKGVMEYHFITENEVFYEKQWVRFLPYVSLNSWWMDVLLNYCTTQDSVIAYTTSDFIQKLNSIPSPSTGKLLGFKLKEIYFFDMDRLLAESRILGLSPLWVDTVQQDTIELYWLYYPAYREAFASLPIESKAYSKPLKNLDDVFFYRYFSSFIYEEKHAFLNTPPHTSSLSKAALKEASYRREMEQLETEHRIWRSLIEADN